MAYTASKERVVKNTAFLYVRTLIMLVIGVFTSRITLQALGVDNYGIVNVVSGFVGMFTIISGSLTAACQRFITYELGKHECDERAVFSASMYIHLALCVIILVLAETIGLYFVNNNLNLPEESRVAAQWVYQCSIVTFMLLLVNIPFNALIIAHEKMKVYAYISLLEAALKLIVVILLMYLPNDKLILYAIFSLASSVIVRLVFQLYCKQTFGDVISLTKRINKKFATQIFGFAGWSFIGNSAYICSIQGVNIVLNLFCGVAVNAARGIATMVESVITGFVNNFTTAVNPQITKLYASQDYIQLQTMVNMSMRICFFLMLLFSLPIIISANILLNIWFVNLPEFATVFVRISMINAVIQAVGNPFMTLLLASGNIRNYQIVAGIITFLNLPGSYILLKTGCSPSSIYWLAVAMSICVFAIRFYFIRNQMQLDVASYLKQLIKFAPICIISVVCNLAVYALLHVDNIYRLVMYGCLTVLLNCSIIYIIGLSKKEQLKVTGYITSKLHFIKTNKA